MTVDVRVRTCDRGAAAASGAAGSGLEPAQVRDLTLDLGFDFERRLTQSCRAVVAGDH